MCGWKFCNSKKIIEKISGYAHIHLAMVIDPDVKISNRVQIGEGTIICAGNIITVDIEIGRNNIINLDCTVGHDVVLSDSGGIKRIVH